MIEVKVKTKVKGHRHCLWGEGGIKEDLSFVASATAEADGAVRHREGWMATDGRKKSGCSSSGRMMSLGSL